MDVGVLRAFFLDEDTGTRADVGGLDMVQNAEIDTASVR